MKKELNWEGEIPSKPKYRSELFEWGEALVVSLTFVIILFAFFFRQIGVDGNSMVPTLHNSDHLFISNLFYQPKHGDIVVLTKNTFIDEPIVKRVIATEGQTIDINFESGVVTVDGKELVEPYIAEKTHLTGDVAFPCKVPEGCIFVMGDNRNMSSDSRYSALGMVDTRYVLGKVLLRVLPINQFGAVK